MKKYKHLFLFIGIIIFVFGGFYLWIINIDFVGKTAEQVEESRKRMKAMRLEAEYRNPPLHYGINLIDSVNAEIMAGNGKNDFIVFKSYYISKDTIYFKALSQEVEKDKDLEQYLNFEKALVKDSLFFLVDSTNSLLPNPMHIKINKLNDTSTTDN